MADTNHLSQLQLGTSNLNAWRKSNPDARIDLSGALFVTKGSVNDPYDVYLPNVNLQGANLENAIINDALMTDSSFEFSNISGAILKHSNFAGSSFSHARLTGAVIAGCDLTGCDFMKVTLGGTTITNTKLSHVKNLSHIVHKSPSHIGVETITSSLAELKDGGASLEEFVRFMESAGVPSEFIKVVGLANL
jgi:uncharacterized protein YjbI with pentapeptide repeats